MDSQPQKSHVLVLAGYYQSFVQWRDYNLRRFIGIPPARPKTLMVLDCVENLRGLSSENTTLLRLDDWVSHEIFRDGDRRSFEFLSQFRTAFPNWAESPIEYIPRDFEYIPRDFWLQQHFVRPAVCANCRNYCGQTYQNIELICAIHPYGWQQDGSNCADWEEDQRHPLDSSRLLD
jgi:hypothetical protein